VTPPAAVSGRPLAAVPVPPLAAAFLRPLAAGAATVLLSLAVLLPALLLPGTAAAATVPAPAGSGGLTLELTQLTPRIVSADGPPTITVVGNLRNLGDHPVDDLEIRLQRGEALRTDGDVRDALAGTGRTDAVAPNFTPLADTLAPGGSLPVQLTVALRGTTDDSLALDRNGVYELLVNVNGVPQGGLRARLAAVRMLLPVLSLPAGPDARAGPVVPAAPGPAADLTVLYPLADTPHRLPTVPGEQTLLSDDDLARSLAPDGRLGGLLAAYAERARAGSAVRAATCLAVDPDLVGTVAAMRQGYAVRAADGTITPGSGAQVAGTWLDSLIAAARGGCVVALPFADADLVTLTRADLGDLAETAVAGGRTIVADTLGTPVVDGTTWPSGGVLDQSALGAVVGAGDRTVVLRADSVDTDASGAGPSSEGVSGVVPLAGAQPPVTAVLTDPLLSRAAAAPGGATADPGGPVGITGPITSTAAGTSPALATQDALAALVFRVEGTPSADGPVVLAPPHEWSTDATGARALLDAVDLLASEGRVSPRELTDVVAAGPVTPGPARRTADPLQTGAPGAPQAVVDAVREMHANVTDLQSAAVAETGVGASLDAMFGPLAEATLRPASAAWHDRPDLANAAAATATARISELRRSIRVLEPPSPYSLGTRDAPLLITIANGLPVTMEVRLSISSTTGLRVAPIPAQRIPPLGRRQVQVDAQVVRSGQFVVEATVRTPAGRPLGPPSRLQVRSTAYGTITVWLTGCAGVLLVVLAARRVVRRIRGEPSRRDRVGPPTGPLPGRAPPPDRPEPPGTQPPASTAAASAPQEPEPPTLPVPARPDPEPPTRPVPVRRP
jgi:Family of unknown function (DUF6049)